MRLFQRVINEGTTGERQAAYAALGNYQGDEAVRTLGVALDRLVAGKEPAPARLDVIEAVETQNNPDLMRKLEAYQAAKPQDDPLARYRETLAGGDARSGARLFYSHEAAQCVRCHSIFEMGGNAGPGLAGVGSRLTDEQILQSIVDPSAVLAPGYGMVVLQMQDQESITGIVLEESEEQLRLKIGKEEIRTVDKSRIAKRDDVPSSMPPMGSILSKREIRDVVAFLSGLKSES